MDDTTQPRFAALGALTSAPPSERGPDQAEVTVPGSLLVDALTPIRYPRVSAWTGHIPFLFSLMGLHRPRRFVELGTHHGASFFAACQASRDAGLGCQCIAVDHWLGDEHAGTFTDDVFHTFHTTLVEEFEGVGTFVRADFDAAAGEFDDGSVDLLHIDGYHTYEAASHDYSTWRRTLSSRGAVIFHDVHEFQEGFGAWRFWQELEAEHPGRTFLFTHWHGLGVLSLDDDPASPINRFLDRAADPAVRDFLRAFYEGVADREVFLEERVGYTRRELKAQIAGLKRLHESQLTQAASQARSETEASVRRSFEESTSWRLTKPVRAVGSLRKR